MTKRLWSDKFATFSLSELCRFSAQITIMSGIKRYIHLNKEFLWGTNCALLIADLFLYYYERDIMLSLSEDN